MFVLFKQFSVPFTHSISYQVDLSSSLNFTQSLNNCPCFPGTWLVSKCLSVLVLWWSRCLLVSSCLRTELLCFSPGLIRQTGPEPGLAASLLAPGLDWQSKLLRYRHVSLLLLSHAFLASDAVDFYPQYTFIFIFWNLLDLPLAGNCSY